MSRLKNFRAKISGARGSAFGRIKGILRPEPEYGKIGKELQRRNRLTPELRAKLAELRQRLEAVRRKNLSEYLRAPEGKELPAALGEAERKRLFGKMSPRAQAQILGLVPDLEAIEFQKATRQAHTMSHAELNERIFEKHLADILLEISKGKRKKNATDRAARARRLIAEKEGEMGDIGKLHDEILRIGTEIRNKKNEMAELRKSGESGAALRELYGQIALLKRELEPLVARWAEVEQFGEELTRRRNGNGRN